MNKLIFVQGKHMGFLRDQCAVRPWWINILFLWCLILTIVVPIEVISRPFESDIEVWFGVELFGWWAKVGGLAHAILFTVGSWGFFKMRSWMWPWCSVYVAQVAFSHLVWSELSPAGNGIYVGVIQAAAYFALAVWIWKSKSEFRRADSLESVPTGLTP